MFTPARTRRLAGIAVAASAALVLSACGSDASDSASDADTVTITDNHGEIEVPVDPERVVALDNTTFETLSQFGVELVAAPKGLMGKMWTEYTGDDSILDAGMHFEPNLEAVIEAEPDLIIGGYRFSELYDELVDVQPATVEVTPREGEDHTEELKRQTELLGQIFGKEDEAAAIIADFEDAIAAAGDAYDGESTVMGLITSEAKIAYASPSEGRGVSQPFQELGLVPALDQEGSTDHQGDDISLESIAAANPEWLIVLDRDGAFQEEGYVPAETLISEAEVLQEVPAVQKGQIVVLDPNFYLDEGIQAYTTLYQQLADAFGAAS